MSNYEEDTAVTVERVLGRRGARELTPEELELVSGSGPEVTNVITVNPVTGKRDGDGYLE
jgi:hypothetical protein